MALLPWIETIPLLRVSEHTLISGRQQNLYYSSLYHEPVYLTGLQLIYTNPAPLPTSWWLMICESNFPDTWTPFFYAPSDAITGYQNEGADPVQPLPEPYLLQPGRRLQIAVMVDRGSFTIGTDDSLNLVGVRQIGGDLTCSS